MKPQIVVIHGGMVYETHEAYIRALKEDPVDIEWFQRHKKWKDALEVELGNDFEILRPEMPSPGNAKYDEWSIWFGRMVPFLRDGVILIGHSLGGIFLARYLSEHVLPIKIKATLLLAAPFDDATHEALGDFCITESLKKFEAQGGEIHLWASKDDPVVLPAEVQKYAQQLPAAHLRMFEDKGHFSLETFPELTTLLKELI